MRHGGGKRVPKICEYVQAQGSDVLVVTEHRNHTSLANQLSDLGYKTQTSGVGDKNTVLVAAKEPGEPVRHEPRRLIGLRFSTLTVLGTYFAQNNEKRPLFEYLLSNRPMEPTVLVGDFNTGEHFKDEKGRSFLCADLFGRLSGAGWLRMNSREPTWYSSAGNGFCIDHAFITAGLNGTANFDHSTREIGLTDHSALHVKID